MVIALKSPRGLLGTELKNMICPRPLCAVHVLSLDSSMLCHPLKAPSRSIYSVFRVITRQLLQTRLPGEAGFPKSVIEYFLFEIRHSVFR